CPLSVPRSHVSGQSARCGREAAPPAEDIAETARVVGMAMPRNQPGSPRVLRITARSTQRVKARNQPHLTGDGCSIPDLLPKVQYILLICSIYLYLCICASHHRMLAHRLGMHICPRRHAMLC